MKWGNYRVSYTYSKALDDVSEFFFSAPINNFNIWQDYCRSDDDQRSRLAFEGTVHSSLAKAIDAMGTLQPRLPAHHFADRVLSAAVQHHDGSQHHSQGTSARPTINGVFINRNAGEGHGILNLNLPSEPDFRAE